MQPGKRYVERPVEPVTCRESLQPLADRKVIDRCARLLPGVIDDTTASTKHALRALATRWLSLATELDTHDEGLDAFTMATAPTLRQAFGIGSDSAAEMMIVAGDNPTRSRSAAAFAGKSHRSILQPIRGRRRRVKLG